MTHQSHQEATDAYTRALKALAQAEDVVRYLEAEVERLTPVRILPPDLGNTVAREGLDRCHCGCKYWEYDQCVDCGCHVSRTTENIKHCPDCGKDTQDSQGWSTGQCDDCYLEDQANKGDRQS